MKKLLVIGLAALLVLGLTVGIASATVVHTNTLIQNGLVTINQSGVSDVVFLNTIRSGTGGVLSTVDFNQSITTGYGNFYNNIDLHGWGLKIDNQTNELYVPSYTKDFPDDGVGPLTVPAHRAVAFNQNIYMLNSDDNYWGAKSTQQFTGLTPGFIAQEVQVYPLPGLPEIEPDTLNLWGANLQGGVMNNQFLIPQAGGRAQLGQTGTAWADFERAKTWSNIGGVSVTEDIATYNDNPMSFSQIIMYQ